MHYYTFHPKDYISKTYFLEPIEDIAYRRMLDYIYLNECHLPNDIEDIAKKINMRSHIDSIANVLREFFDLTDDGYMNDRAEQEIAKYQEKSDKAKKSANARWNKKGSKASNNKDSSERNANALPSQSEGNANHKPRTINQELITSLPFDDFWNAYDYKKGGLTKPKAKWQSLTIEQQELIMAHIPDYVKSTPAKKYRKQPMTYLNNEGWLDEITDLDDDQVKDNSARPHSNRSDSFDSQPQAQMLSHEEQIAANKISMEKAGLKV